MRRVVLVTVCLLSGGVLACGDEDRSDSPASEPAAVQRPADEDVAALVRVASKYLNAFVDKDWAAACQTRSREERREFARLAGSCEQAFEAIERSGKADGADVLFRRARARAAKIEIRGARARVPIFQPGQARSTTVLLAERESGRWLLVDVPEAKEKAFLRGE